jgi:signal transduction histidine kinase
MLSVSEIEAGSFKLRAGDVRLETVFEELKSDFGPQAEEKHQKLSFDLPPKLPAIQGDRDKIVLALHNLIGNALKYTPESGNVNVKVEVDGQRLVVEVTDTGIGISQDETDLIFEKFYRAKDKRVSDITGTGLGLALAREVVRLHGGDISVRSELNKGSTFTMSVPTHSEAA